MGASNTSVLAPHRRLASPALLLEEKMTTEQFHQLLTFFRRSRRPPGRGKMSTHDFRANLARLLGREETDEAVAQLSAKASTVIIIILSVLRAVLL